MVNVISGKDVIARPGLKNEIAAILDSDWTTGDMSKEDRPECLDWQSGVIVGMVSKIEDINNAIDIIATYVEISDFIAGVYEFHSSLVILSRKANITTGKILQLLKK